VVERRQGWGLWIRFHVTACSHQSGISTQSDLVQHGNQQGGLVFAVAVFVFVDVRGEVRLVAANANLNGHVADLA
jgi:hypothetical protein